MNLIKNLKIGARLGLGFGFVLLLLALVAGLGLSRMAAIQAGLESITRVNNVETRLAVAMRIAVNQVALGAREIALLTDTAEMQSISERMKTSRANYDAAEAELGKMFETLPGTLAKEKELFAKIKELKAVARPLNNKAIELGLANKGEEATRLLINEVKPVQSQWLAALGELAALEEKLNEDEAAAAEIAYKQALTRVVAISVLAVALGALAAVLITRSITRPIGVAVTLVQTVASGDLTSRITVDSRDETGQLLSAVSAMQDNLTRVVGDVRRGVDSVTTASSQIAAGNQDLSSRTEQQASSLQETASSMEQLSGTVRQSADNAQQANQLAASASEAASRGGDVVGAVVTTMEDISASSKKISDIIGVIDGIAFQTNILALNAAVEAARAGEQGRGFAVVAGEVRSLAQRSAEAAKEIKSLIGNSVEKVETGSRQAADAGAAMSDIVAQVRKVTDLIGEIASAAQEQSSGISQVNQAVTQMDQVTQQNAALVEESAAAASSLSQQAQKLAETVAVFKLARGGSAMQVATVPAPAPRVAARPVAAAAAATKAPPAVASAMSADPAAVDDGDWASF